MEGMMVMLDVNVNNVGPLPPSESSDADFSSFVPFSKPENYHKKCRIMDWTKQEQRETCWLQGTLPDLDTSSSEVKDYFTNWK